MTDVNFSWIAKQPPEERDFVAGLHMVLREKFFDGHIDDIELMLERADDYDIDLSLESAISETEIRSRIVSHFFGGTYEEAERLAELANEVGMFTETATAVFRKHEHINYDDHVTIDDLKHFQGKQSISRRK